MQQTARANIRYLYLEIAFYGVLSGIAVTFLPVYALRLGASDAEVGWLAALPALVTGFSVVPATLLTGRRPQLDTLLVSGLFSRLQYLLLVLAPLAPAAWQVAALVIVVGVGALPTGIATVAFTVVFSHVVLPGQRAHVVSIRNLLLNGAVLLAALLGGKFLELLPLPLNYQMLFLVGVGSALVSLYLLSKLRAPALAAPAARPAQRQPVRWGRLGRRLWQRGWSVLGMVRAAPGFAGFCLGAFLLTFCVQMPLPLYSLFMVRTLQAPESWIGLQSTVFQLSLIVSFPVWGRIGRRQSSRRLLLAGSLGISLYPFVMAAINRVELLLVVAVAGGVFLPGYVIGVFNGLLEAAPPHNVAIYIAIFTSLTNVAAFLAPLVATTIAVPALGIAGALVLGGVLRVLGCLAMWIFWRDIAVLPHVRILP